MAESTRPTTIAAWLIMLAASLLPNIIGQEVLGQALPWLWLKSGLLAALLVAGFVLPWLKPLRPYMVILLLILAANYLFTSLLADAAWWPAWLGAGVPFSGQMLGIQLQRLAVTLVVLAALLLMGYRRRQFFLVRGQLDAPSEPVRWLGYNKPARWRKISPPRPIFGRSNRKKPTGSSGRSISSTSIRST